MIELVPLLLHQLQKHLNKIPSDSATQAAIIHHYNVLSNGRVASDKRAINIHLAKLHKKIEYQSLTMLTEQWNMDLKHAGKNRQIQLAESTDPRGQTVLADLVWTCAQSGRAAKRSDHAIRTLPNSDDGARSKFGWPGRCAAPPLEAYVGLRCAAWKLSSHFSSIERWN